MKTTSLALLIVLGTVHYSGAQVVINELCASNGDVAFDPDYFNFSGWIELHNTGTSAVTIGGHYLSNDKSVPLKWRIPTNTSIAAKGYLLIWCDERNNGNHANFSLDTNGEEITYSKSSGVLVDKISYPKQFTNISYGRTESGSSTWGYIASPTPALINNGTSATEQLEEPLYSLASGRYSGIQSLSLFHANNDAEIRYTTDGSDPSIRSSKYTTPISVTQTTTVKAKAFASGYLPGKTSTETFFINEHTTTLPIVSISTNPTYLTDNTLGIYVQGTNGIAGYCQDIPANWNQDWDRHAVFEYFDKDGNKLLCQSVDIRIGGNCSRSQAQKSLVIKAREKYGSNIINHRFFKNKDVHLQGGLVLRNSGNDFNVTMFRDALMHVLPADQMDIEYQDYQPAILYLNGVYMGIQNIREKIDADFIDANYSIDKTDLDLIETYENALEGSSDAYVNYRMALEGMDRSTSEAFAFIDQHIDVQEYINYLVTEIYYGNTDWPGNNIKFWRQRSTNGKFRWILWDLDFGFALYDWASWASHPTLNFATATDGPGWPNPEWSTLHIRLVLENPIFRARFIQTMNTALNTTFHPDRVIEMINHFQETIRTEVPYHKQRWWGSINDWNYEVQRLRDFALSRNIFMRQHMADFFGLSESVLFSANVSEGQGKIKLNEITFDSPMVNQQYLKNLAFKAEPVSAFGYAFKEWKITKREATPIQMISLGDRWKYYDSGTLPDALWFTSTYEDALWTEGAAQLGYGEGDEVTVVSFGTNPSAKFITTYFRKKFSVASVAGLENVSGTILFDDGIVVYCNGVEVYRANMPATTITNETLASGNAVENSYQSFTIPANVLMEGDNVLAVEVHQVSLESSDISFDLSLSGNILGDATQIISTEPIQQGVADSDVSLEASFIVRDVATIENLIINEINALPDTRVVDGEGKAEDWIEFFNGGEQPINLAGLYITDNLNLKAKHKISDGANLLLNPGEYKILWADEDIDQGADHLSFKLSAEGEAIGIYQIVDGNVRVVHELLFTAQPGSGSFSRIPNATGPLVYTSIASPMSTNELVAGLESSQAFDAYPNPVTNQLTLVSEHELERIQLLDSFGRQVSLENRLLDASIDFTGMSAGVYVLRVELNKQIFIRKVIKQ